MARSSAGARSWELLQQKAIGGQPLPERGLSHGTVERASIRGKRISKSMFLFCFGEESKIQLLK